jgi:hypothetical protein
MAELLVKAEDFVHPDPDEDKRGSYKRGDVVVVKEDGAPWGAKESLAPSSGGKFSIVKLAGETVASLTQFCVPETVSVFVPELNDNGDILDTCRRWRLNIDELPPGIITAMTTPGSANLPIATLLAALERKVDGVRGDEI